jgi:hypothetical protein
MTESEVIVRILDTFPPCTWVKRKTISFKSQEFLDRPMDVRTISDAASALKGRILSSGTGYMLATKATEKNVLESYGCVMRKAIGSYRRANAIIAHARAHGVLIDASKVRAERSKAISEVRNEVRNADVVSGLDHASGPTIDETYEQADLL